MSEKTKFVHWADIAANRIIKSKGDKVLYVLATGITPSGVVHFGNFRETITVELVKRALEDQGKKVRMIFSWDDYDTFRKVPKDYPNKEMLERFLFRPIVDVPDAFQEYESHAQRNEIRYEKQLKQMGIQTENIYQSKKYRNGDYKEMIKLTLHKREEIINILNKHRTQNLHEGWMPVSLYCSKCDRDKIKNIKFDGNNLLSYECELCAHRGEEDIDTSSRIKLPWRMDWPMRWTYEKVDFEPGGKDHSSDGGSFATGQEIVKLYGGEAPLYVQYDFVSVKGAGGKMSSSEGNVLTLTDVLNIYGPQMICWIFASYKTNVDFSISFDLDVIKTYESFDRQERLAYGVESGNQKKVAQAERIFELSVRDNRQKKIPFRPAFRHLCNILQINEGDLERTKDYYLSQIKDEDDENSLKERASRALFWIKNHAPEDFKFKLNKNPCKLTMTDAEKLFISNFVTFVDEDWESIKDDKEMHHKIYEIIHQTGLEPDAAFKLLYQLLISKDKGPKLAGFIRIIGKVRVRKLLNI